MTLIELIVAIGISTLLAGVTLLMLKTGFDTYFYAQEQMLLEKVLDDCLVEASGGGFERYGIKDALEVLNISPTAVTFVPLWVDDTHTAKTEHSQARTVNKIPFILNRPFKAGSSLPICEAISPDGKEIKPVPIAFIFGPRNDPLKPDDTVFLAEPVTPASKLRFIFAPDAENFADAAMTIRWDGRALTREYRNRKEIIPQYKITQANLADFKLQYFDNANNELEPINAQIPNITALKVTLNASFAKARSRTLRSASTFINLRNTRSQGAGLIIRKETTVKIPDSRHIRVFSIANISGIKDGGFIELEAHPKRGTVWKLSMQLGFYNEKPMIKRYFVEYPAGTTVYSETVNLTSDLPLNFMNLGATGRYDYDFDKDTSNVVNLEGDVELKVTQMDANGAMLFIRP